MKKFIALLLIFNASFPEQEARAGEFDFSFEASSFTFLTPPIRFEELNGAMIVELAKKRGFMPIIYPRRESLYHWLDYGNRDLLTLEQLIDDPHLFKKPKPLIKKNLFISQKIHEIAIASTLLFDEYSFASLTSVPFEFCPLKYPTSPISPSTEILYL